MILRSWVSEPQMGHIWPTASFHLLYETHSRASFTFMVLSVLILKVFADNFLKLCIRYRENSFPWFLSVFHFGWRFLFLPCIPACGCHMSSTWPCPLIAWKLSLFSKWLCPLSSCPVMQNATGFYTSFFQSVFFKAVVFPDETCTHLVN